MGCIEALDVLSQALWSSDLLASQLAPSDYGHKSVIPLVASHFIDQYLSNLNQLAVTVLLAYYGLYILQTLVPVCRESSLCAVSYSIVRDIRRDAFANMEKLGMSYFDKTPAGEVA